MAREDIIPQILAAIFAKGDIQPTDDNTNLNKFSSPNDKLTCADSTIRTVQNLTDIYWESPLWFWGSGQYF